MEIISKICSKCKLEKILEDFRNQRNGKFGKKNYCIKCDNLNAKELYEKNKEKRKGEISKWNRNNPEKMKQYQEDFKKKHNKV